MRPTDEVLDSEKQHAGVHAAVAAAAEAHKGLADSVEHFRVAAKEAKKAYKRLQRVRAMDRAAFLKMNNGLVLLKQVVLSAVGLTRPAEY